jgi:hypothetical protein
VGASEGGVDRSSRPDGQNGMAWTPTGAERMGKVTPASQNGELERDLGDRRRRDRTSAAPRSRRRAPTRSEGEIPPGLR